MSKTVAFCSLSRREREFFSLNRHSAIALVYYSRPIRLYSDIKPLSNKYFTSNCKADSPLDKRSIR